MEEKICLSCKLKVSNDPGSVRFKCPQCGKFEMVRCSKCRKEAIKYTCPNCEFTGPN